LTTVLLPDPEGAEKIITFLFMRMLYLLCFRICKNSDIPQKTIIFVRIIHIKHSNEDIF